MLKVYTVEQLVDPRSPNRPDWKTYQIELPQLLNLHRSLVRQRVLRRQNTDAAIAADVAQAVGRVVEW